MNSSFECIPIDPLSYDLAGFSCRDEAMGAWLDRRAWDYHTKNFSRVWILTPTEGDKGVVAGYFTLSSTMLQKTQLSRKQRSAEGEIFSRIVFQRPSSASSLLPVTSKVNSSRKS